MDSMTRRGLLGAAASAPLCAGPQDLAGRTGMAALCQAWLAVDDEMGRQMGRWARLETLAAETYGHGQLSSRQFRASPMGAEMETIDDGVGRLGRERRSRLQALNAMWPASLHDLAGQLAVAARVLGDEGSDAEPLVSRAAAYLGALRCPGCGAPCRAGPVARDEA